MTFDKLIMNAHMVTASGDSHGNIYKRRQDSRYN